MNQKTEGKPAKISLKKYLRELKYLHGELVALQRWVQHEGLKVCIIFEGRDGAGKGGTIKAITERVSPRVFRTVALPTPTEREAPEGGAGRGGPRVGTSAGPAVRWHR